MASSWQLVLSFFCSSIAHLFFVVFWLLSFQQERVHTPIIILGKESAAMPSFYKNVSINNKQKSKCTAELSASSYSGAVQAQKVLMNEKIEHKKEENKKEKERSSDEQENVHKREELSFPEQKNDLKRDAQSEAKNKEVVSSATYNDSQNIDLAHAEVKTHEERREEKKEKLSSNNSLENNSSENNSSEKEKNKTTESLSHKNQHNISKKSMQDAGVRTNLLMCQCLVQKEIQMHWRPPIGVPKGTESQLFFSLFPDGSVKEARLIKPSTHILYNLSIEKIAFDCHFHPSLGGKSFTVTFRQ